MRRTLVLLVCWLLAFATGLPVRAQAVPVPEYALKSALLFKLPQFVYRNDIDRSAPLTLCLIGSNPFGNTLDKLAQTPVDGRTVRLQRLGSVKETNGCEFVFISRSEEGSLAELLRRLGGHSTVTVSDIEGFARAGGMVEFALGHESSAISILINRRAAQQRGIEFNAQLLRLAKVVEP